MERSMSNTTATWVVALAALACPHLGDAHHSGYMYETTSVWVAGTVVSFERVNPHTLMTLEARNEAGEVRRWVIEGPPQSAFERRGIATAAPNIGDAVEFCAFPYRSPAELSQLWPGVDFSARRAAAADGSPQFLAGHVLISSDGAMQLWEPHGILADCIRSSEERTPSWVAFLTSDQTARQAWCAQQRYEHVRSNATLRELVQKIDGSIGDPCD
jgi:hypothetical protein